MRFLIGPARVGFEEAAVNCRDRVVAASHSSERLGAAGSIVPERHANPHPVERHDHISDCVAAHGCSSGANAAIVMHLQQRGCGNNGENPLHARLRS